MSASYQHLLCNNEAPNDSEIQNIAALISTSRRQIRSYISASVTLSADDLTLTLQSIKQYNKFRLILSPIRRIPSEILVQIFQYLLSDDDDPNTSFTPLAHVCRHWRLVIRPLLPSAGTFCSPSGTITSNSRTKDVLKEFNAFLESMPLPGSSLFSLVILDPLRKGDLKNPLVDTVFSQSHRLFSLEMTLEASVFISLAERLINQLNKLQVLKLTISGNPGKYAGYLYLFESAKSLRHLELISSMKLLIKFPVSQLVSYKEWSLADINVKHMLQYGPKLKRLEHVFHTTISNPYFLDPWIDNPRQLTSLDLRTYNVDASYTRSVDHEWSDKTVDCTPHHHFAIPSTSLPHLRDIRIRDPDRNLIPSLIHLIQNSSSGPSMTITKLALCGLRCQDGQLYKLLTLTPNLTYLEYNDISTIDTILLSTKPLPVPLLQTLIVHSASNVRDIRDFVCNRNAQGSLCRPLSMVRLLYQNPDEAFRQMTQLNLGSYSVNPVLQSNILMLKRVTKSYVQGAKKRLTRQENQSIFRRMLSTSQQDDNRDIFEALAELEAVVISDPFMIKLDYIHTLHSFSLLRLDNGLEYSGPTVSQRVQALLDRWIAAFQLQELLPSLAHPNSSTPRWIMIGPHCISLDGLYSYNYPSAVGETWAKLKDVPPTEYDILHGHYRCPTTEEIFWVHKDCSYDSHLFF